ncbi:DUF6233 domain-containing protein [Streptomyces sp. CC224B]|uniref:DUF6233 domain-containing protein n=1 Tax=Streptomyces sp. CC224B TaxID=3044571 RepID=UPI0032BF5B82
MCPIYRLTCLAFASSSPSSAICSPKRRTPSSEPRDAERQRGLAARPPQPNWAFEGRRGLLPIYVHKGGCHMAGKHRWGVIMAEARRALIEGIAACPHCQPDKHLGLDSTPGDQTS